MATINLPPGFKIDHAQVHAKPGAPRTQPAPLGVLAKLSEKSFTGTGLNTIFRPNSGPPPLGTSFPNSISPTPPAFPSDNVLELNLTKETITFSQPLSAVANRGFGSQNDIFLNGVPYIQAVNDVSNMETGRGDGNPIGIHFETGMWMKIPATDNPALGDSLVRMGSIPHGTTINAQCLEPTSTFQGAPNISPVSLKPFGVGNVNSKIQLNSLNIQDSATPRLPQDLSRFNDAGTITQDVLDDPNTVLRNSIKGQNITQTITFTVSTDPPPPDFGGGAANIAFLLGNPGATAPNANAFQMQATFWVETVEYSLTVPAFKPGQAPMEISAPESLSGQPRPVFLVSPPYEITSPKTINVTSTQIQYSQVVFMNFDGITWPHISVSTLVPSTPVLVPDSVWS
ncbi:hypothetical protein Asppvi_010116 [Aspergillus pseudoviridinutans]|uniref:Uncharacterized protein n=1 Tax=Aspergillus pseudoviridinutans TaxID=1517512 RepID=A0A9P3EWS7_9EURO|nr:uncharacterized protein Asppvi_010116 [Aspergillus pseudoviridinutans]GIJ91151.1 hypothetical protein Asppvi_010116 [Aspergillus pseudoviridinutans]